MDICRNLFIDAFKTFHKNAIVEVNNKQSYDDNPDVMGGKYIHKRIHDHIKKKLHLKVDREYIFDNTRICICIYSIDRIFPMAQLYDVLNFYIYTLNKVSRKTNVKIKIYLCDLKKQFPKSDNQILNEFNVNSGATIFDNNNRYVVIYRKEELYKVLLHELIHFYEIDFHNYNMKYDRYFIKKFQIEVKTPVKNSNTPLALYESYTDTLACYGHTITYALFHHYDKNIEDMNRIIDELMTKEIKHYTTIASKILKFSKLKEDTHCFSYYIVKAGVYENFPKFIDLIKINQGLKLDTLEKQELYLKFIRKLLNNKAFWTKLSTQKTNIISLSSLKMTKIRW